ncbi:MAG: hypothetical protein OXC91_13880 [Rhodobacteraceae bacterium]|nr:hypothetical protein [Paracoccaceae bacterium]
MAREPLAGTMQTEQRVICHLTGGLGNQLFQYANAFAVARRNNAELILDTRDLKTGPDSRRDLLAHFALSARIAAHDELPPHCNERLRCLAWRHLGRPPQFIRERGLGVNGRTLTLGAGCYLHGYFQSERYFAACSDLIRTELQAQPGTS